VHLFKKESKSKRSERERKGRRRRRDGGRRGERAFSSYLGGITMNTDYILWITIKPFVLIMNQALQKFKKKKCTISIPHYQ
jgi:hypothetical protein